MLLLMLFNNNNNNNNNNNSKEKTCTLIDVTIPADRKVVQKEAEKKLKYKSLCIEIQRMWNLKYMVIPVIIGATGIVTRSLRKNLEAVPEKHSIDSLQKTAILGTSHIIRKVLQCEAWSLSGGDHRWFKRSIRKKRPLTRDCHTLQLLLLLLLILLLLFILFTEIGFSPGGNGYFTCIQNMKLVTTKFKSGGLHEKHVVATWHLGNHLSISLNSSAIRSHIWEVGTVLYILVAVPSKWLFRIHVQCPVLHSFQLEKSIPKTQVIPHWQNTWNRLSFSDSQKCKGKWRNLTSNCMRERRKSKEKSIRKWGYGEREMVILWRH